MNKTDKVREIPFSESDERVETGPIRFGDDWPGLFLRGDTCIYLKTALDKVLGMPVRTITFDQRSVFTFIRNIIRDDVIVPPTRSGEQK